MSEKDAESKTIVNAIRTEKGRFGKGNTLGGAPLNPVTRAIKKVVTIDGLEIMFTNIFNIAQKASDSSGVNAATLICKLAGPDSDTHRKNFKRALKTRTLAEIAESHGIILESYTEHGLAEKHALTSATLLNHTKQALIDSANGVIDKLNAMESPAEEIDVDDSSLDRT